MTEQAPIASIPVAWLKPIPASYRIPIWRWLVLPASTFMLKRRNGVWMSGTLALTATELRFTQSQMIKTARAATPETWSLPIESISQAIVSKGLASETINVHHSNGITQLMTARAGSFIDQLQSALAVQ